MTTHLWDGQNIVAESANGQICARYYRGANLIAWQQDANLRFYMHNAHGDVVHIVQNWQVLYSYDYDAFGNEKSPNAEYDGNPFRYCGEYYDREIENVYLRARYYDTSTGRFTSEDSVRNANYKLPNNKEVTDPYSLNLYCYCFNNPLAFADEDGHLPFLVVTAIAGAIIGGAIGAAVSYKKTGKVSWKSVAAGAAVGGLIGLGAGAAAGLVLAGSATASTAAIVTGAKVAAASLAAGGTIAGGTAAKKAAETADKTTEAVQNTSAVVQNASTVSANTQAVTEVIDKVDDVAAEASKVFSNGQLYETSKTLADGTKIEVLAETVVNGKTLALKDVAMYSTAGDIPNKAGTVFMREWLREIQALATSEGFEQLIVSGQRAMHSSSANPGSVWERIFDLLK